MTKLKPLRAMYDAFEGIPAATVTRLLEQCDTARQSDTEQRIWIVECDGDPYTVWLSANRHKAMIVRGTPAHSAIV